MTMSQASDDRDVPSLSDSETLMPGSLAAGESHNASVPIDQMRCGFVALLGAPNAGKSTLLNHLIGQKLSIVTPKVQTTRARMLGIAMEGKSQIVFIDTPGIFKPGKRLERAMVEAAWKGVEDADLALLLVDVTQPRHFEDVEAIARKLQSHEGLSFALILNKVDLIKRDKLLAIAQRLSNAGPFEKVFMISALTGDGVADVKGWITAQMPQGPWHYPEDQVATLPMRILAAEITREKLFLRLYQELPYALTVETERWQNFDNGSVKIEQVIFVERETQKAIILGKKGAMIKTIRAEAQKDLEDQLDCPVHLFLFVKVQEHWGDDPDRYEGMGLDFTK